MKTLKLPLLLAILFFFSSTKAINKSLVPQEVEIPETEVVNKTKNQWDVENHQIFYLNSIQPHTNLDSCWVYHQGDSMIWAEPGYDDR